ncbi:MAG: DNRLRE domain-containing protein, partial [Candidatus Odinarchaeota archaeon]
MKKRHIKIFKNKVIFISLAILSFFLLIINFIPFFGASVGITTKYIRDLDIDRVAYVNQSNPDMNHYNYLDMNSIIGNSCQFFVHFNLQSLPKETKNLYFTITGFQSYSHMFYIKDFEMNLILVDPNWNSSEISWNNKPKHEEIIETVNASAIRNLFTVEYYDLEKTVDLTEIFEEIQQTEISFCINITENNEEMKDIVYVSGIKLLYSYEQFLISYTAIISS